jgi:hypothetical protein
LASFLLIFDKKGVLFVRPDPLHLERGEGEGEGDEREREMDKAGKRKR